MDKLIDLNPTKEQEKLIEKIKELEKDIELKNKEMTGLKIKIDRFHKSIRKSKVNTKK